MQRRYSVLHPFISQRAAVAGSQDAEADIWRQWRIASVSRTTASISRRTARAANCDIVMRAANRTSSSALSHAGIRGTIERIQKAKREIVWKTNVIEEACNRASTIL
jgi:hypothetical protein